MSERTRSAGWAMAADSGRNAAKAARRAGRNAGPFSDGRLKLRRLLKRVKTTGAACQAAVGRFGRVDVWIDDAGVIAIGRFDRSPLVEHEKVIDTNLKGAPYGSYEAVALFRRQGFGV